MSTSIGIMQGRLLPPIDGRIQAFPCDRWAEEFALAKAVGFDMIEFVFEGDPSRYPLLTADGCLAVQEVAARAGLAVVSVCGDYFMDHPLHGTGEAACRASRAVLVDLITHAARIGVRIIVIPCVDASTLRSSSDHRALMNALHTCSDVLRATGVRLALETDLGPKEFRALLADLPRDLVGVNYDMGNSASLGFEPDEELHAYGDRIISVHVKDRVRGGTTVELGTGDTDFRACFAGLAQLRYEGPVIIQGARGNDDVATAARYFDFVHRCLATA